MLPARASESCLNLGSHTKSTSLPKCMLLWNSTMQKGWPDITCAVKGPKKIILTLVLTTNNQWCTNDLWEQMHYYIPTTNKQTQTSEIMESYNGLSWKEF